MSVEMETHKIFPASPKPQLSLPLTIFDVKWLIFPPTQRIFCYESAGLSSNHFNECILHKLKRSLSLTLDHFYVVAGHIIWPSDSPRPLLSYTPNDAVSLAVAHSPHPELFTTLIADDAVEASLARGCVPELRSSGDRAQVIALKVTLFPNLGFAVGIACHHGFIDGFSFSMFMNAWSFLCHRLSSSDSDTSPSLPPSLVPHLERPELDDPEGIYEQILERSTSSNPRSVQLPPSPVLDPSLVRRKFMFSRTDSDNLRKRVINRYPNEEGMHLSRLVLVYSLAIACRARAKNFKNVVYVIVPGNYRARLGLQMAGHYLGNCDIGLARMIEAEAVKSEGVAMVAKCVGDIVKDLKVKTPYEALKTTYLSGKFGGPVHIIGLSGSPRFGLHKVDFGWGMPVKVFCTSIDGSNSIAVGGAGEDDGDIEIDVVMEPEFMEEFEKLFVDAIKAPL